MTTQNLKIFNTLTHAKETFAPASTEIIKMYACGPTVYDNAHLGNARSFVFYDLLFRILQIWSSCGGIMKSDAKVTYVRNITDVDDKIIARAKETAQTINQITSSATQRFWEDTTSLNCLKPTHEPKVTDTIPEICEMIQKLLDNNSAYQSGDEIFFNVSKFENYGKLSNKNIQDLISGVRIETNENKRSPLDFVLWKNINQTTENGMGFDSPFGYGRPGWHIECSAMSAKYLGHNFDIHGGGVDLSFPHHENEIAQSLCAHKNSTYAKYWIHNGFLMVNGTKMSKSLGNFTTVKDIISKVPHQQQNITAEALRLFLLSTHYQKPCDFTEDNLRHAQSTLHKFYEILNSEHYSLQEYTHLNFDQTIDLITQYIASEDLECLFDNINISKYLAKMHLLTRDIKHTQNKSELVRQLYFMGIAIGLFYNLNSTNLNHTTTDINQNYILATTLATKRLELKKAKQFSEADELRTQVYNLGFDIIDKSDSFELKTK